MYVMCLYINIDYSFGNMFCKICFLRNFFFRTGRTAASLEISIRNGNTYVYSNKHEMRIKRQKTSRTIRILILGKVRRFVALVV